MSIALRTVFTVLISAAGALVFGLTDIGGSMLLGGAVAVTIAVALGFKATIPDPVRNVIFICVGLSMGASVSPDTLQLIPQWPITLAALVIELILIVAICGFFLIKVFGLDKGTAYLSSFPGHLSFVVALATAGTGDSRKIVVIQVIRVALLTLLAPLGALFLPVGTFNVGGGSETMSLTTLAMAACACALTGFVFTRIKVPAAYVLGSMAAATILKLAGFFPGQLPVWFVEGTFIGMGGLIGARFAGLSRTDIAGALVGGIGSTVIAVMIVSVIAFLTSLLVDMPFGQIWLGLSPGGLESMGALGIALGYDTAFIAAHHVFRILLLTLGIPIVLLITRPTTQSQVD